MLFIVSDISLSSRWCPDRLAMILLRLPIDCGFSRLRLWGWRRLVEIWHDNTVIILHAWIVMLLAFLANRLLFSIHFDVFCLNFCTFIYMDSNIVSFFRQLVIYLIFLNIIINGWFFIFDVSSGFNRLLLSSFIRCDIISELGLINPDRLDLLDK